MSKGSLQLAAFQPDCCEEGDFFFLINLFLAAFFKIFF